MRRPRRRLVVFTAVLCIAVLMAASVVEAAHFCELFAGTVRAQASTANTQGNTPHVCVICATAHQASMGAAIAIVVPTLADTASTPVGIVQPHSRLRAFTMDVRPPPAV